MSDKTLREKVEELRKLQWRNLTAKELDQFNGTCAQLLLHNAALFAAAEETAAELARIKAALPKTADGISVIPQDADQRLWRIHEDKVHEVETDEYWQHRETNEWHVQDQWSFGVGGIDHYAHKVSDCYSTESAALAALNSANAKGGSHA